MPYPVDDVCKEHTEGEGAEGEGDTLCHHHDAQTHRSGSDDAAGVDTFHAYRRCSHRQIGEVDVCKGENELRRHEDDDDEDIAATV